ncbi:Uncharacterised protein [Serratia grimesii]|uniref:hypothetical protein n=1 Tax=Serratia grimesii TaxID=82995 RepID=UPI00217BB333|nr:hypothetical protein [Serratia grimesii]CAI1721496.1 Uncharacterised protein [Serratia grimesii]
MKVQAPNKTQHVTVLDVPGIPSPIPAEKARDGVTLKQFIPTNTPDALSMDHGAVLAVLEYAGAVQAAESVLDLPEPLQTVQYSAAELSFQYRASAHSRVALDVRDITRDWRVQSLADIDSLLGIIGSELVNRMCRDKRERIQNAERERQNAVTKKIAADYKVVADGYMQLHQLKKKFSATEVQALLDMVTDGKPQFAEQMADGIDLQAVHAALGADYRTAADAWAKQAQAPGACTFSLPLDAVVNTPEGSSFNMAVQPGGKWILNVWTDSGWYPIQASLAAREAALQQREQINRVRNLQARGKPITGEVFADELQS